jgi:hypothetical protein
LLAAYSTRKKAHRMTRMTRSAVFDFMLRFYIRRRTLSDSLLGSGEPALL